MGEVTGKPNVYGPLYEALASGPKSVAELMAASRQDLRSILQAVSLMLHAGHIAFFVPPKDFKPAQALNRAIAQAVAQGAPYNYLVAPACCYVFNAKDSDLMFLAATLTHKGPLKPETLAQWLVQQLLVLGKGLKDGEAALTTAEAMMPKAKELAQTFLTQTLPTWKRLGVIGGPLHLSP